MELTRTIIVSSLLILLAGGCATTTSTTSPSGGTASPEGSTEEEIVATPVPEVTEPPSYQGAAQDELLSIPDDAEPRRKASLQLTNKGKTALAQNQVPIATKNFEQAISIDPNNPYAYYYSALLQYRLGNTHQALGHLQLAKVHFADQHWRAESHVMAGRIQEELRAWQEAAKEYEAALTLEPDRSEAKDGLSRVQNRIAQLQTLSTETEQPRLPAEEELEGR